MESPAKSTVLWGFKVIVMRSSVVVAAGGGRTAGWHPPLSRCQAVAVRSFATMWSTKP